MTDTIIFPGTLTQAMQSQLVLPGSRLLLHGGNYLVGDLQCALSNVTITNFPDEQAILIPASGTRALLFGSLAADVILDGLIIDAVNVAEGIKITSGATNITIKNCEIKNATGQGIIITHGGGTTTGTLIENCHVHHCGTDDFDHGIYIRTGGTIIGCEINNNIGYGVHAYAGIGDYTIEKCYIHDNGDFGIGAMYGNAIIKNNVMRGNGNSDIRATYDIFDLSAFYNTLLSAQPGIAAGWRSTDDPAIWTIQNNLCIGNTGISIDPALAGVTLTESNNLTVADITNITDNGANSIIPQAGHSAIGGGVAISGITTDYAGTTRANPPTIGAYE